MNYISLTQTEYDDLPKKRYPEAKFIIERTQPDVFFKLHLDGLKYFYGTKKYEHNDITNYEIFKQSACNLSNIVFAGGMFTSYIDNSPFAHHFPELFDHYKKKHDIDVWVKSEEKDKENYFESTHFGCLNIIELNYDQFPCGLFDFDCCKVWCNALDYKKVMLPITLLTTEKLANDPSFDTPYYFQKDNYNCICVTQIRRIKYCFKNCFSFENIFRELLLCKHIFSKRRCFVCHRRYQR